MTEWTMDFMTRDGQLVPRTLGELVAAIYREKHPHHTAKHIERRVKCDPVTARNAVKGHAGVRFLTAAMATEGWELIEAIGHALTGQTHHEWEEQKLRKIVEEAERAQESIRSLRSRREQLETRARELDARGAGPMAGPLRRSDSDHRQQDHADGPRSARAQT